MKLGCHVSMSAPDYVLGSVKEAISYGANAFMLYTGAPQNTTQSNARTENRGSTQPDEGAWD